MDYFQSVQYFQWLYLQGAVSLARPRLNFSEFVNLFLSARLDWVCMGVL